MRTFATALLVACSGGSDPDLTSVDRSPSTGSSVPIDPYAVVTPAFTFTDQPFEDRRLTTAMPPDGPPRGVLFVFHGTNGDVASVTQTEWLVLYNRLVPEGVALVITTALDEEQAQWDLSPATTNPDFQRLSRIRDHLIATTAIEADTPVLAIGFSHGAAFAPVFVGLAHDAGWDVRGFAFHQAASVNRIVVPGFFVSAENDEQNATPEQVAPLAEQCSDLTLFDCPHRVGHEIPLHPLRFVRLPQYGEQQSRAIFDEMVDMGLVDADGIRLVDLDETGVDEIMDQYVATSRGPSPTLPPTQLRVVWATHRFSAEHAIEEAAWLLDRISW